jgi:hypothetical protein
MPEVCVVHLVWAPLGTAPLRRFVASYRARSAGLDHRLVMLFKGFADREDTSDHVEVLDGVEYESILYSRPTFDLPAYSAAAHALDASQLCFLNSESVLLADGWLAALAEQLADPDVGVVGATGSYESPRSLNPLRRRRWIAFPNPHLRTNAFMTSRELMRTVEWPEVRTKVRAWELESGRRGLTRHAWSSGLHTLVVGRDGHGYPPETWPVSRTFRSGEQENLLVADNRTRQWEEGDGDARARLSRLAWGVAPATAAAEVRSQTAAAGLPDHRRTATR